MNIELDPLTITTLESHLSDINIMIAEDEGELLTLTHNRVECLVNSMIMQISAEGENVFEEYDETV